MPPSQLKQLKASLRENGILAPQKSKKQRKTTGKDAQRRMQRNAALEGIREKFNPFETKAPARRDKFDISSNKPVKKIVERPGVTRGLGEERRRETLLKEMQSRNKVGGMLDRRFGEDDPNMTPEQKAAERFAQQALRSSKKNSMFNLEDDSEEELQLTHGGRALELAGNVRDARLREDFDEDLSVSEASDFNAQDDRPRKKARYEESETDGEEAEVTPERKRTKKEVMEEVIAKSKAYKAARQAQKEDDDELRAELDQGLNDIFDDLIQNGKRKKGHLPSPPATDSEPAIDPGRAALLAGKSREEADKEYEANLREMKMEARSKPSLRSKTEEEIALEQKTRLEDMERKRLRRMKGEVDSSDEDESEGGADVDKIDDENDDAEAFGLEQPGPRYIPNLAVEDEDEFVMDEIVASDSEADLASDFEDQSDASSHEPEDDGDDDFINGLVLPKQQTKSRDERFDNTIEPTKALPFTFSCPQSLEELLQETARLAATGLPIAVQRIRALYHKGLASGNDEKLGKFGQALIPWVAALVNNECPQKPGMQIIEQLLRHIHSMAKAQPLEIGAGFREYFRRFLVDDRKSLDAGDLALLTGAATIFPTSDQWHSVVTPAMLILARCLGQARLDTIEDLAKSIYACTLLLKYQQMSQRYAPEAVTFLSKAIQLLMPRNAPTQVQKYTTPVLAEDLDVHVRIELLKDALPAALNFDDLRPAINRDNRSNSTSINASGLLLACINLVDSCIDLYTPKSAYSELVSPFRSLFSTHSLPSKTIKQFPGPWQTRLTALVERLNQTTELHISARKPLLLHNHRPVAIKSSYPLFDESYNPTRKQRDPDAERAEMNKLRAEHRKERKGAMRELRKDANFMAREQLREKKIRDEAYEKKFKRLVAEIQGEEGREAKAYDREKSKRKNRF